MQLLFFSLFPVSSYLTSIFFFLHVNTLYYIYINGLRYKIFTVFDKMFTKIYILYKKVGRKFFPNLFMHLLFLELLQAFYLSGEHLHLQRFLERLQGLFYKLLYNHQPELIFCHLLPNL